MAEKKAILYYLYKILEEYSDEQHPMLQKDIMEKLAHQYDVELDRKTISANLQTLVDVGINIRGFGADRKSSGVYLGKRLFSNSEVSYLVDAIFSSKGMSDEEAIKLANKVSGTLSKNERKEYNYIHKSSELFKPQNNEFFKTISLLKEAIQKGIQVKFNYETFDEKGNKILRQKNGKDHLYFVNPYYLVNNFGKYYLICTNGGKKEINPYRIDYIRNLELTENPLYVRLDEVEDFVNIAEYINKHIYIMSGPCSRARILVKDPDAMRYVYDWFGERVTTYYESDGKLYAIFYCNEKALLYWMLQYSKYFEVIKPVSVREELIKSLQEALDNYK